MTEEDVAISSIYSAAVGKLQWSGALDRMCRLLNAHKGILYSENVSEERGGIWVGSSIEQDRITSYQEYYASVEPLTPSAHRRGLDKGQILTIPSLVERRDFWRSEYFNDFWKPQGIREFIGSIDKRETWNGDRQFIHLTFYRDPRQTEFDDHDGMRLSRLRYHVDRALSFTRNLTHRDVDMNLTWGLLNSISCAALVLDRRLKVVSLNERAEAAAAKGGMFSTGLANGISQAGGEVFSQKLLGCFASLV